MVAPRKAALLEESAEVEVLFANMEKMKTLTKKIQGSVNRLDASGKAVQEAIGPIYGNTQKLQIANTNVDRIIEAIERLRAPREESAKEERIIRAGPGRGDLDGYIASLDRTNMSLADLKRANLRSNEQAVAELSGLLKLGNKQLEDVFRGILQDSAREKVQALEYVAKRASFVPYNSNNANTAQKIPSLAYPKISCRAYAASTRTSPSRSPNYPRSISPKLPLAEYTQISGANI
jgi:exocyst complex protein 7